MSAAYLIVTILAAAANIFSATCDFVRYKQVSIAMAKAGVPESWMTMLGILKAAGALGTAGRHQCSADRDGRRSRAHPVLCRRHHHPPARTRLLVPPGGSLLPACRGGAGAATGLVVSKPGRQGPACSGWRVSRQRGASARKAVSKAALLVFVLTGI